MDETTFRALGDSSRRAILDRLYERDGQTLRELEEGFDMTRFGVMKHLRVLEEAGLVVAHRVGREKFHFLNPVPIREIHNRWIGKFAASASDSLLGLRDSLEGEEGTTMEKKPSHVFVVFIRATPEQVWEAITTSEFTVRYYYSSTVESAWEPGAPYRYSTQGHPAIEGRVLEADPPRKLVCTFDAKWDHEVAPDAPSRITWMIEPAEDGVSKVTVVHDDFQAETATFRSIGGGMPFILSNLKTLLETGAPLVERVSA